MLNDLELDLALAQVHPDLLLKIRMLLADGWELEAERLLPFPGPRAKEVMASMIRRMVVRR